MWDHLAYHLINSNQVDDLHQLFANRKWIKGRAGRSITGLIVDLTRASNLPDIPLVARIRYMFYQNVLKLRNDQIAIVTDPADLHILVDDPQAIIQTLQHMGAEPQSILQTFLDMFPKILGSYRNLFFDALIRFSQENASAIAHIKSDPNNELYPVQYSKMFERYTTLLDFCAQSPAHHKEMIELTINALRETHPPDDNSQLQYTFLCQVAERVAHEHAMQIIRHALDEQLEQWREYKVVHVVAAFIPRLTPSIQILYWNQCVEKIVKQGIWSQGQFNRKSDPEQHVYGEADVRAKYYSIVARYMPPPIFALHEEKLLDALLESGRWSSRDGWYEIFPVFKIILSKLSSKGLDQLWERGRNEYQNIDDDYNPEPSIFELMLYLPESTLNIIPKEELEKRNFTAFHSLLKAVSSTSQQWSVKYAVEGWLKLEPDSSSDAKEFFGKASRILCRIPDEEREDAATAIWAALLADNKSDYGYFMERRKYAASITPPSICHAIAKMCISNIESFINVRIENKRGYNDFTHWFELIDGLTQNISPVEQKLVLKDLIEYLLSCSSNAKTDFSREYHLNFAFVLRDKLSLIDLETSISCWKMIVSHTHTNLSPRRFNAVINQHAFKGEWSDQVSRLWLEQIVRIDQEYSPDHPYGYQMLGQFTGLMRMVVGKQTVLEVAIPTWHTQLTWKLELWKQYLIPEKGYHNWSEGLSVFLQYMPLNLLNQFWEQSKWEEQHQFLRLTLMPTLSIPEKEKVFSELLNIPNPHKTIRTILSKWLEEDIRAFWHYYIQHPEISGLNEQWFNLLAGLIPPQYIVVSLELVFNNEKVDLYGLWAEISTFIDRISESDIEAATQKLMSLVRNDSYGERQLRAILAKQSGYRNAGLLININKLRHPEYDSIPENIFICAIDEYLKYDRWQSRRGEFEGASPFKEFGISDSDNAKMSEQHRRTRLFFLLLKHWIAYLNPDTARRTLDKIIETRNLPDLANNRPFLERIGGKKLREQVQEAYNDAQTWWLDIVCGIE